MVTVVAVRVVYAYNIDNSRRFIGSPSPPPASALNISQEDSPLSRHQSSPTAPGIPSAGRGCRLFFSPLILLRHIHGICFGFHRYDMLGQNQVGAAAPKDKERHTHPRQPKIIASRLELPKHRHHPASICQLLLFEASDLGCPLD